MQIQLIGEMEELPLSVQEDVSMPRRWVSSLTKVTDLWHKVGNVMPLVLEQSNLFCVLHSLEER